MGQDEETWMPCQNCSTWSYSDGMLRPVFRLKVPSSDAVAVGEMEKRRRSLRGWRRLKKSRQDLWTWTIRGAGIRRRAGFKGIVSISVVHTGEQSSTLLNPWKSSPDKTILPIHFWTSVRWFSNLSICRSLYCFRLCTSRVANVGTAATDPEGPLRQSPTDLSEQGEAEELGLGLWKSSDLQGCLFQQYTANQIS